MRPIKVRYWVRGKNGKLIARYYTLKEIETGYIQDHLANDRKIEGRDLFTGLLDKNGKEVFEGDIVEFVAQETNDSKPRTVRQIVHYESRLAAFFVIGGDSQSSLLHALSGVEVVGNIYENPELTQRVSNDRAN